MERHPDDSEPFSALAFKIATDPFVGKLAFSRVYSGVMKSGSYVLNSNKGKKERIGRLVKMHANHREEVEELRAGDIAAVIGLKMTTTGDTLCDEDHPIFLKAWNSQIQLFMLLLSQKQKLVKKKWVLHFQSLLKKIQLLKLLLIKKQVKQLLLVWVSFT